MKPNSDLFESLAKIQGNNLEASYESDKDLHDRCLKLREHLLAMMPELFGSNITD
jgi:hypothetical protein